MTKESIQERKDYAKYMTMYSKEALAKKLVKLGEQGVETEDWIVNHIVSEEYAYINALGKFLYGTHEWEVEVDKACKY